MSIFTGMNITSSALTAQRLRLDVVSSNMANSETTRGKYVNGEWEPYKRKMVVFEPIEGSFKSQLSKATGSNSIGKGVRVAKIIEDETPSKLVYNPMHPDADKDGYVKMPNVDPLKEMVDLMSATRSYEANVTVLNATKSMLMKALEISK